MTPKAGQRWLGPFGPMDVLRWLSCGLWECLMVRTKRVWKVHPGCFARCSYVGLTVMAGAR